MDISRPDDFARLPLSDPAFDALFTTPQECNCLRLCPGTWPANPTSNTGTTRNNAHGDEQRINTGQSESNCDDTP